MKKVSFIFRASHLQAKICEHIPLIIVQNVHSNLCDDNRFPHNYRKRYKKGGIERNVYLCQNSKK